MSACVKSDPSNNPPAPEIQRESANKNKISYPDKSTNHIIYSSFLLKAVETHDMNVKVKSYELFCSNIYFDLLVELLRIQNTEIDSRVRASSSDHSFC